MKRDERSTSVAVVAAGLTLTGLAVLSALACVADLVRVSGPAVGDIVAFDATTRVPDELPSRWTVMRADGTPCDLDLDEMQRVQGSLIVAGAAATAAPVYQLHWAGRHSSLGGRDCGATADILASDRVMSALLVATGGVGIGPRKQALPVYLLTHTPKALD